MGSTELEDRKAALAAHMKARCTARDDDEASFLAGWDAAIDSIRHMSAARIADHRKAGIIIVPTESGEQGASDD